MARRPRVFAPGILYHVIVRGGRRRKTFTSAADYQAYLERLAKYRGQYGYTVYAFCLMPNHAHLLMESSGHPLAKFMQGLQQSYTQYFNRQHRKRGHLFQGRYKAIVCQKDAYLLELIRYVHLNPVRAGLVKAPERYRYSGHHAYLERKASEIIEPAQVLGMVGGSRGYRRFVQSGIKDGHKEEYYAVEDQRFLGEEGFAKSMRPDEEKALPRPRRKSGIDAEVKKLSNYLKVEARQLRGSNRSWAVSEARTTIAYVIARRLGYRLKDVAAYFGRSAATMATLLARRGEGMQTDPKQKLDIDRLIKKAKL